MWWRRWWLGFGGIYNCKELLTPDRDQNGFKNLFSEKIDVIKWHVDQEVVCFEKMIPCVNKILDQIGNRSNFTTNYFCRILGLLARFYRRLSKFDTERLFTTTKFYNSS